MREASVAIRLQDYRPPDYRIEQVALAFSLAPRGAVVRARSQVRRAGDPTAPLVLQGERLRLTRIAIDGQALSADSYSLDAETLTIHAPPAAFTLEIDTEIDPIDNTALEGLYMSGGRYCTQCEAEGFRKITYFLDRPDVMARYQVRIEAPKADFPTLLSNGNLVESGDLDGGRHFAVWDDPFPKPSYLFALCAGAYDSLFDTFTTMSGRTVQLGIHVDPGDAARCAYAMDSLKRAMRWDEEKFGREYDLDVFNIVAVRDFNFGAMENKGLNVFNSSLILADPETASDLDYESIEAVVGHEYFHNWTGDRITCRDWFQLCLKEGLTVYRDQEFSADQRSRPVQRIKDVKRLRARQFPEDAGPLAHPVRPALYQKIDNFYTATVYEKGGEVIRMLRAILGEASFKAGMDLYFERCDGMAATVEDFVACFADASGVDLAPFMGWYNQAGTPAVTATGDYDQASRVYTLKLRQDTPPTPGQPHKQPLPIPLRVGFINANGARLAVKTPGDPVAREEHLIVFDSAETQVRFEGVAAPPIPALLRGFSAPVRLNDDLTPAQRLAQMAYDPDPFTRWEAGQALARAAMLERAGASGAPDQAPPLDGLIEALARELEHADKDAAFAALALRLPDAAELIQIAERPDPDALHRARAEVRLALATRLRAPLEAIALAPSEETFSPSAEAAGRRALKTMAFDLLAALGEAASPALEAAFDRARTMTESIASLEALGNSGASAFDRALDRFYARWRDNPLVVDKWFSAQAAPARADSLARVEALRLHADFSLKNPNRVRALLGAFTMRNPRAFHAADGGGYRFAASLCGDLDPINPAVAARQLGAFESWRRFDAGRRAHAEAALSDLAARKDLSKNAREIVERMLSPA